MPDEVVPFGKYRGQPLESLAGDRQYLDWLTAQPWFRDRYPAIYTVVVNNFKPPEDTPEHNALQALFLDPAVCERITVLRRLSSSKAKAKLLIPETEKFIAADAPGVFPVETKALELRRARLELADLRSFISDEMLGVKLTCSVKFEVKGIDVQVLAEWRGASPTPVATAVVKIEVKPTVGDDYPSILRQMKAVGADTLFLIEYVGSGVTEAQFRAIFANERIKVVFRREIERDL